jgi:phage/plasmid-like protein (TIGR03299 family)
MAHEVTAADSGWMFHEPAWHGLFEVGRKRPKSIAEARKVSGLTWDVDSVPFVTIPQIKAVERELNLGSRKSLATLLSEFAAPNHRAIVRSDTLDVLGTWTDEGVPITNKEGFEWMEALLGETRFEALFSIRGGKQVCLLSEFPDHIIVGGDEVRRFLYARLDHTGSGSMQTMATNVRVQCANTDRAAISDARARDGIYRVRHMGDTSQRLHEAREALGLSIDYAKQFKKFGDRLAKQKIAERTLQKVLAELYPASSQTDRAVKSAERRRQTVMAIFNGEGSAGDTRGNAPGTKWCAYNAVVEYQQHYAPVRVGDVDGTDPSTAKAERRFVRSTEDPQGLQAKALDLLVG